MKGYKTLEDWNGYEKGTVVPEDVATKFLKNYARFEDQSILEEIEYLEEQKVEEPKVEMAKPVKKETKKTSKKSRKKY
mgnify:CR=1 FL=1